MEKSKKRSFFKCLSLLILLSGVLSFSSCTKNDEPIVGPTVDPPFLTTGFHIVNEGNMKPPLGSFTTYSYATNQVAQNPDLEFGTTTCYAEKWLGKIYFVSKQGKRLVVVDEKTMTKVGLIEDMPDGRAFVGVDENIGVLTTNEGAYRLNIKTLELGKVLDQTNGVECGGITVVGDYLFIIQKKVGILVYDIKKDFAFVKELGMASVGFVMTKDGSLWAANTNELLKINPATLTTEKTILPEGVMIRNNWGGWNKGSLAASMRENVLWFTKAASEWGGGNEIYRYEIGNISSLNKPFIKSTDAEDDFYGSGIAVDPTRDIIIAIFTKKYAYSDNRLVFFDSKTGVEKKRTLYEGFYFPGMIIFNY